VFLIKYYDYFADLFCPFKWVDWVNYTPFGGNYFGPGLNRNNIFFENLYLILQILGLGLGGIDSDQQRNIY
jgi:hypothetical protein